MNIKPIRTKADYKAMLAEIEGLMMARANTPEGERLDVLVTLVEAYERKHFTMEAPDPVEAIKSRMENLGLKPKDLQPMIGGLNRVYEVLNYRRPLTIRRLHDGLGIPAESLIKPSQQQAA